MKLIILAIAILILSLTVVNAQQIPRSVLQRQLIVIEESLRLNQQRQEDYRRQGRNVPDYLTEQQQQLEGKRQEIQRALNR
jgi:hypothetical protein